jgi:ADP-ribose pyrophosphatase
MKKVFQGDIFSVWQWEQELYDGSKKVFEKVKRSDSAGVIGVLPDKRIMLVWDEQPGRDGVLTCAGGQIEEGEEPAVTAKREFLEETGYRIHSLTPWLIWRPAGKMDFTVHLFIGREIEKVAEPQNTAGERTEVRLFTFDEFLALGQNETLRDMRIRITLLEAQLDPKKKEELYHTLYG